jgi:hypothetical protein
VPGGNVGRLFQNLIGLVTPFQLDQCVGTPDLSHDWELELRDGRRDFQRAIVEVERFLWPPKLYISMAKER